jgi:hypothetical protein
MYGSKSFRSPSGQGEIVTLDPANASLSAAVGVPVPGSGVSGIDFDQSGNLWGSTLGDLGEAPNLIQINPNTGALINDIGQIHTNASDVPGSGTLAVLVVGLA